MNKSDQINELATALSKAQGAMGMAKKDKSNPFFHSTYADLAGAIDAAKVHLSANGLSVVQLPGATREDGTINLETMLIHASGQYVSEVFQIRPVKNDPQGLGSAITYARRYAYMAIVGLAPEDDDGNSASQPKQETATSDDEVVRVGITKKEGPNKGRSYKYKIINGKQSFLGWIGEEVNSSLSTDNHE